MHFNDLDLCTYHPGPLEASTWAVPLRAIGWLEHPHAFATGTAPDGLVAALTRLVEQTRSQLAQYRFRGAYDCSFCSAAGCKTGGAGWSQENLIVPGAGEIYAAPGAVVHYIADHSYLPPPKFIAAVMACPDCGSSAYFDALRRVNREQALPLESKDDYARRIQSFGRGAPGAPREPHI